MVKRMCHTFVGQWDVGEPESQEKIEAALRDPDNFVLKPNREGGGNNFYGQELATKLNQVRGTSRAQEYILMELIQPVLQDNFLIRPAMSPELVKTVSEIGIFGIILARGDEVLLNKTVDQVLVRSKAEGVREGGVSSGHSCISSPIIAMRPDVVLG